ncbi:protein TSSC4-like [Macrosteles quadrilineatus]|uniref:protein TSSC4-like n=1 Tax=Macrosteles quadrilineatus TaxID=74068 RepID=UPI0023E12F22|nr:protein TSSC4-like [Macrosteles quadrilineatus]
MINQDKGQGRFFVQTKSDNNADFVSRQKNVFEKLDAVMKSNESSIAKLNDNKRSHGNEEKATFKRQKSETRPFRGQESIFKRPEAPAPSRFQKNLPDFLRRPDKWTKYTLSDVSQDDMSDQSNTAAAMSFLRELRAKKESQDMDVDSEKLSKPTFKKTQRKREVSEDKSSSQIFRSSKVVMPEYVVGEKKPSSSKKQKAKPEKGKEIKLDHLDEEEDDELC